MTAKPCSLARVHVPGQPNPDEHQMQLALEVPHKICTKCGQDKPLEDFHRWKNAKDGRFPSCKVCKRQDMRDRLKANPEHVRALAAASRESRREQIREQERQSRAENPERYRAADRRKYEKIKRDPLRLDRLKKYNRDAARRRRLGVNEGAEAYAEIIASDPCAYCGGPANTVDHIEPVSKGGEHVWDNLTASCASCNFRKSKGSVLGVLLKVLG